MNCVIFFKTKSENSFSRCFRCRNYAISKATRKKKAFGGVCINGIYEYTHPIIIKNETACVIFIGNILDESEGISKLQKSNFHEKERMHTLESNFTADQCKSLCLLIEDYILHLLDKPCQGVQPDNILIENIKNYILSNLEYNINIVDVSKIFHYNPVYLGRIFKKKTAISFNEYLVRCRIKKAQEMLINTDFSCIRISTEIGFNNVTYFNKIFKKHTGITPMEYRKKSR